MPRCRDRGRPVEVPSPRSSRRGFSMPCRCGLRARPEFAASFNPEVRPSEALAADPAPGPCLRSWTKLTLLPLRLQRSSKGPLCNGPELAPGFWLVLRCLARALETLFRTLPLGIRLVSHHPQVVASRFFISDSCGGTWEEIT